MVASLVLYYHWEAMLISYLATRKIVLPFTNMEELISKTSFKVAVMPGTSYEDTFKYATEGSWQTAWNERIQPYLDDYKDNGGNMIQYSANDPNIALYDNFFSSSAFGAYTNCDVIAIPGKYNFKPYAYGFQKHSPYLGLFNYYLKEMREKGALKKILKKWESPGQACPDMSGQPLGFESCFTAFLALLIGLTFGMILIMMEFISDKTELYLPGLEAYDRKDNVDLDLEERQDYEMTIHKKNLQIIKLEQQIKEMRMKVKKYSELKAQGTESLW